MLKPTRDNKQVEYLLQWNGHTKVIYKQSKVMPK